MLKALDSSKRPQSFCKIYHTLIKLYIPGRVKNKIKYVYGECFADVFSIMLIKKENSLVTISHYIRIIPPTDLTSLHPGNHDNQKTSLVQQNK